MHAPISAGGPKGALAMASAWITFRLEIGAIGVVLVVASRMPEQAKLLVWTIIGIEVARGITNDV